MLSKGVPIPYDKRFAMIIKFIEAVQPMKGILMSYLNPEAFAGMGARDDEESDDEHLEDQGKVKCGVAIKALLDESWWAFASLTEFLRQGPQLLLLFSRSCPCHKGKRKVRCPATGLVAPWFAAGKHIKIIEDACEKRGGDVLLAVACVPKETKDLYLGDYDLATRAVFYVVTLKSVVWLQLPLVWCGLGHPDEGIAWDCGQSGKKQWEETQQSTAHHDITLRLLVVAGPR